MSDVISAVDTGRVRTLTIERPEALNAMNNDVFVGLRDSLDAAAADDSIAVVVVTGRGRAFCAGLDLAEAASQHSGADQFPSMLQVLAQFPKPLIAAVNGLGVGIGMTMLAHCDLVLMADDAKLRTPS